MNYRHLYHAGSFADVMKHCILIAVLEKLKIKPTPFSVLDTHAGIGLYPLESVEAQKKQEYRAGVEKIFFADSATTAPTIITTYRQLIQQYNLEEQLHYYPGSPLIIQQLLREQDHLTLCELHPQDYETLKDNTYQLAATNVHCLDAYLGMKAFLPPKSGRGLVLIDPPFEVTDEFARMTQALTRALKHFANGIYMMWYPIKDEKQVAAFHQTLTALNKPVLQVVFTLKKPLPNSQLACTGITLINPPWQLDTLLTDELMPYLAHHLEGTFTVTNDPN